MRVGVAVVTYNSVGHIEGCLDSLRPYANLLQEGIVVIDNASTDASCAVIGRHPDVMLVANAENRGFAAAVNQAFRLLPDAEAVLLLNPDVQVGSGLTELVGHLGQQSRLGVVSGMLTGQNGSPQAGFCVRRFPTATALSFEVLGINRLWAHNPVNRRYRALDLDLSVEQDVEQPAGAFLLIRREAWLQLGGFDERFYPAWFEDVDFLLRAHRAGWGIRYFPSAQAVHAGGHSIQTLSWRLRQRFWYGNLLRYTVLHDNWLGRIVVSFAVMIGSMPRAVTGMVQQRSWQPLVVYCGVMGSAASAIISRSSAGHPDSDGLAAHQGL